MPGGADLTDQGNPASQEGAAEGQHPSRAEPIRQLSHNNPQGAVHQGIEGKSARYTLTVPVEFFEERREKDSEGILSSIGSAQV